MRKRILVPLDADLVVMPTRGRPGVTRLLFGSVAEQVATGPAGRGARALGHTARLTAR